MKDIVDTILSPHMLQNLSIAEKADFYNCIMQSKELLKEAYQFFDLPMPTLQEPPSIWIRRKKDVEYALYKYLGADVYKCAHEEVADKGVMSVDLVRVLLCFSKNNLPSIIRQLAPENLEPIKDALLSDTLRIKLEGQASVLLSEIGISTDIYSEFQGLHLGGEDREMFSREDG